MASGVIKQPRDLVVEYRSLTTDNYGIAWLGAKQGYKLIAGHMFSSSGTWLDCIVSTYYQNNIEQYGVHAMTSETGDPVTNSTDTWELVWIKL